MRKPATHILMAGILACLPGQGFAASIGDRLALVPAADNPPVDVPATAMPGDTLVRSLVMYTDRTAVIGAQLVAIGPYVQALPDGYKLVTRQVQDKAEALTGLKTRKYFCTGTDNAAYTPVVETEPTGQKKSRNDVTFCFADEDSDGSVDHAFAVNRKHPELLKAAPITPFPVQELKLSPKPDPNEARLIYKRLTPEDRNILLYVRQFKGKQEYISSYFKVWQGEDGPEQKQDAKINLKYDGSFPFELPEIIGYRITIDSLDPKTGAISYRYKQAEGTTYFQSVFNGSNPGMIFIFYH